MRKKLSVPTGIAQLEKLAGGATVLALALGATACGFAPSTEPVASPSGPALVDIADADVSDALVAYSSYAFQLPASTKTKKISVTVKSATEGATPTTLGTEGCILTSAPASGAVYATTCTTNKVTSLKAAGKSASYTFPDSTTDGEKTLYFAYKSGTSVGAVLTSSTIYDTTAPTVFATHAFGDKKVTVTLTKPASDGVGSGVLANSTYVVVTQSRNATEPTAPAATGKKAACTFSGNTIVCTGLTNNKLTKVGVFVSDKAGNVGTTASALYADTSSRNKPGVYTALPTVSSVKLGDGTADKVVSATSIDWTITMAGASDALIASYSYSYGATVGAYKAAPIAAAKQKNIVTVKSVASATDGTGKIGLAEGANYLWVKATDNYANESTALQSNRVYLDTQAPSLAITGATTVSAPGGLVRLKATATVTNTAKSGYKSAIAAVYVTSKSGTTTLAATTKKPTKADFSCSTSDVLDAATVTYTCLSAPVSAAAGARFVVYGVAKDAGGLVSDLAKAEGTTDAGLVTFDTTAPDMTAITVAESGAVLTLSKEPADADLVGYVVAYAATTAPASCLEGSDGGTYVSGPQHVSNPYAITLRTPANAGDYTSKKFRVCAVDLLGNVAAGVATP